MTTEAWREVVQALVDAFPFYVMVVDRSHRILIANAKLAELVETGGAPLPGAYCPKAIHGTDQPFPGCPLEEAIALGHGVSRELFDTQHERWVRTEVFPLSVPGGPEGVYLHFTQDITEKRASELRERRNSDMLHVSNELLQVAQTASTTPTLLERALDLVLTLPWLSFEGKGAIFLADDSGEHLTMAAQRGLGERIRQACRTVPFGTCLCGRAAKTRSCIYASGVDDRHDVTYADMSDHGHYCVPILAEGRTWGVLNIYLRSGHPPIDDEISFLEGIAGTLASILSHRRAEENRAKLAAMLDSATDYIGTASPDGRALYVNAGGRRMLGIPLDEDIAGTPLDAFHPETTAELVRNVGIPAAIANGSWTGETALLTRAGQEIPTSQVVLALRGGDGEVEYLSTIIRDMSAQKELEAQLRQAQKLDAIGKLASGVAHDFNNLLSVVTASAGFLLDELQEGPLRQDAVEILEAAGRAAELTRQLLAFSRKEKIDPRVIDVNATVRNLARMLTRLIGEHIALELRLGSDAGTTCFDPAQLEQILVNLAVNARDAMPSGGRVIVETRCVHVDAEQAQRMPGLDVGPHVALDVIDSGTGMAKEVIARIFEPFFTTKPAGKGTGLGLSMVYGAVAQNGGHISVDSKPNQGTTFRILLKQAEPAAQEAEQRPSSGAPGKVTVLLVEDDEAVRRAVARMLAAKGYAVIEAFSGEEAVRLYGAIGERIAAVVSDVVMPSMGGVQMVQELSAFKPDLRVVFMSGYPESFSGIDGLRGVRWVLIRKPIDRGALLRAVQEVLE